MKCKFFPECEDGYYALVRKDDKLGEEACLVYLYDNPDFGGVRHISYMSKDGGAIQPVSELRDGTLLINVNIVPHFSHPTNPSTNSEVFQKRTADVMATIPMNSDEE